MEEGGKETREMQSVLGMEEGGKETREMQSVLVMEEGGTANAPTLPLPPQPQPPQPHPQSPQPTPASPSPSPPQPSSASSPLSPPNPSPPSLPPSPDPKLPSHAQEGFSSLNQWASGQEISSSSPSPPHPFSSTAPAGFSSLNQRASGQEISSSSPSPPHTFSSAAPPSSSSLLTGGMPAHHPSPPPSKPAPSKLLAILRKMEIDVICAILNILAQAASVTFDLIPFCKVLGLFFALLAILFAIGELWGMKKRKVPIGALEYAESVMALVQLVISSLELLRYKGGSFPLVEYVGSLLLALLIGYYKVAKKVGRWHPLETDGNSLIVIRVDCLETAPHEVGKWIYDNRIQDVKWKSADSLARFFGAQQS